MFTKSIKTHINIMCEAGMLVLAVSPLLAMLGFFSK